MSELLKRTYPQFEKLLKKNNVSAFSVAKATDLSPMMFSDWKNGKSVPKLDKLSAIAKHFGVPIEYFLEGEQEDD